MYPAEFKPGDLAYNRRLRKTVRIYNRSPRGNGEWFYAYRVVETDDLYLVYIDRADLQPITVLERIAIDQDSCPPRYLTRTAV